MNKINLIYLGILSSSRI